MAIASNYFYFSLIRKYVTMFGYVFSDIHIERTDATGKITNLSKVPITYGPKDKMLARITEDPNIDRQVAIQLPMMSFEMGGFEYDGSRKVPDVNRRSTVNSANPNQKIYQYIPAPYNINFSLYVYVKNTEDGNKIVEQILPYFTPDWTLTANLIPEMNIKTDIPIVLNSIELDDVYDGEFVNRRSMIWTLRFTLKGYLYGPIKKSGIIKFVNTNIHIASSENITDSVGNNIASNMNVVPGLTANGQPTSNANLSIPVNEIKATDDYGYITTITEIK